MAAGSPNYIGYLITFDDPISEFSVHGFTAGVKDLGHSMTLAAYDADGNLLTKDYFPEESPMSPIFGSLSYPEMKYVTVNYTYAYDVQHYNDCCHIYGNIYSLGFFPIDDITYEENLPIIVIDPGHGLVVGDDGNLHYQRPVTKYFGLREDNLNLSMAAKAAEYLEEEGYTVVFTRKGTRAVYRGSCGFAATPEAEIDVCAADVNARSRIAREIKENEDKDVVFVSIHTNGGGKRHVNGRTQAFYCADTSEPLAGNIINEIESIVPPVISLDNGPFKRCGYGVIRDTASDDIDGAIAEVLYHNDDDDELLLNDLNTRHSLGMSVGRAVSNFVDENY